MIRSRYIALVFITGAKMGAVFDNTCQSAESFKNFYEINSVPLTKEDRRSHRLLSGVISQRDAYGADSG